MASSDAPASAGNRTIAAHGGCGADTQPPAPPVQTVQTVQTVAQPGLQAASQAMPSPPARPVAQAAAQSPSEAMSPPVSQPPSQPVTQPVREPLAPATALLQSSPAASAALPPRPAALALSPEQALAARLARERRDAAIRGVSSIQAMRQAIRLAASALAPITEVPRAGKVDAAAFERLARQGLPFLASGQVRRWPLSMLTPASLRERFGHLPVRARVGDYINTAFAPDRAMQDMSMRAYLELADTAGHDLPPYLGNLELRELNHLCHWPNYFKKMGPPRFWIGPAGTVTPLHCDYDDNVFAQVWGSKRIFLAPPHHDEFLYPRDASAMLAGSPFDPEAPDFDRFPLARQAALIECLVHAGDMLYVPAGWFHQVRALTFSLSSNRWARGVPLALAG